MIEFQLHTADNYPITVHIFEPEVSAEKLLLINSATGVKQQVYFSFAKYFAENGFTVVTYDYRGVGLSKPEKMKGFKASMRIWGTHDYKAVTGFIQKEYSGYEKFCLGHSVGALIIGMNEDSQIFEKFIFVGTQDAYIGNLPKKLQQRRLLGSVWRFLLLQLCSVIFLHIGLAWVKRYRKAARWTGVRSF